METETPLARCADAETWSTAEALAAMLDRQAAAVAAVGEALPDLARAVEAAAARLRDGAGRLVYAGAGSSARIAAQDAAELLPTFGWPPARVAWLIAGGPGALLRSVEGAEDDAAAGDRDAAALGLAPDDVVLAVAASGVTPYTRAAQAAARRSGALTIAFANNPEAPLLAEADHPILLRTGPEFLPGSTRLGAGTAQKVALNLFSTQLMARLGRVYRGRMVGLGAGQRQAHRPGAAHRGRARRLRARGRGRGARGGGPRRPPRHPDARRPAAGRGRVAAGGDRRRPRAGAGLRNLLIPPGGSATLRLVAPGRYDRRRTPRRAAGGTMRYAINSLSLAARSEPAARPAATLAVRYRGALVVAVLLSAALAYLATPAAERRARRHRRRTGADPAPPPDGAGQARDGRGRARAGGLAARPPGAPGPGLGLRRGCTLMAAGPGLIWAMAHVALGAALLHGGLLLLILLGWADGGLPLRRRADLTQPGAP